MGMEPNRSSLPFARVNPKSRLGQMWAHLLLSSWCRIWDGGNLPNEACACASVQFGVTPSRRHSTN